MNKFWAVILVMLVIASLLIDDSETLVRRRKKGRRRWKNDLPVASQSADKTTSERSAELISPSAVFEEELTDKQSRKDDFLSKT